MTVFKVMNKGKRGSLKSKFILSSSLTEGRNYLPGNFEIFFQNIFSTEFSTATGSDYQPFSHRISTNLIEMYFVIFSKSAV